MQAMIPSEEDLDATGLPWLVNEQERAELFILGEWCPVKPVLADAIQLEDGRIIFDATALRIIGDLLR
jgi:hypothetical protein